MMFEFTNMIAIGTFKLTWKVFGSNMGISRRIKTVDLITYRASKLFFAEFFNIMMIIRRI